MERPEQPKQLHESKAATPPPKIQAKEPEDSKAWGFVELESDDEANTIIEEFRREQKDLPSGSLPYGGGGGFQRRQQSIKPGINENPPSNVAPPAGKLVIGAGPKSTVVAVVQIQNPYAGKGLRRPPQKNDRYTKAEQNTLESDDMALLEASMLDLHQPDITNLSVYGSAEDFIAANANRNYAAEIYYSGGGSLLDARDLFRKAFREAAALLGANHAETRRAKWASERFEATYEADIKADEINRAEQRDSTGTHLPPLPDIHPTDPSKNKEIAPPPPKVLEEPMGDLNKAVSRLKRVLADGKAKPQLSIPEEIANLEEYLNHFLRVVPPPEKHEFAEAVTNILSKHGYGIKLLPEGAIARKMFVNTSGALMFKCTDSANRGMSYKTPSGSSEFRRFEMVPYVRRLSKKPAFSISPKI